MITLSIHFDPTNGALKVEGPVQDRLACFGMMELAKVALNDMAKANASPIAVVPQMPAGLKLVTE